MQTPHVPNGKKPIPRLAIPIAVVLFLVMFYALVFSGGQCERYEQKMSRVNHMRHYMDSIRSKQQLEKLHYNQRTDTTNTTP